jgi:hypothetical protein
VARRELPETLGAVLGMLMQGRARLPAA